MRKRGNQTKIGDKEFKISDFDTQKNEIIEEFKNVKYSDLEVLVYRLQPTDNEILENLDLKYIPTKRIGSSLNTNICQISDINNTLKKIFYAIM